MRSSSWTITDPKLPNSPPLEVSDPMIGYTPIASQLFIFRDRRSTVRTRAENSFSMLA
jgi:hypothetical protein